MLGIRSFPFGCGLFSGFLLLVLGRLLLHTYIPPGDDEPKLTTVYCNMFFKWVGSPTNLEKNGEVLVIWGCVLSEQDPWALSPEPSYYKEL